MKNILQSLLLSSAIAVSIHAASDPVCAPSDNVISDLNQGRYQPYADTPLYSSIYLDTKTIKIDKKNKTIDVWVFYVPNSAGREDRINSYGNNYQNYGLTKHFKRIFWADNKIMLLEVINYSCDGNVIEQAPNINPTAQDITPSSIGEILKDALMKKYKLK